MIYSAPASFEVRSSHSGCIAAILLFALLSLFVMGLFILAIYGIFSGLGAVKGWFVG